MARRTEINIGENWGAGAVFADVLNGYTIKIMEAYRDELIQKLVQLTDEAEQVVAQIVDRERSVVSGQLRDSVDSRIEENTEENFRSVIGFINDMPDHAIPQEFGFRHYKSGEWIPGMFAVRDAALYVEDALEGFKFKGTGIV